MADGDDVPIYEPGDVVYGTDPFESEERGRPWLVIADHEGRPFHGEQYIALTLTTRSWLDDLLEIPETSWRRGGTPGWSRIVPWGVQSIGDTDIDHWQGQIDDELVDVAIRSLVDCLR